MIFEDWRDLTLINFSQFESFDDFTVFYKEKSKSCTKSFFVSFSLSGQNHHVITAEVMFSVVSVCRSVCSQGGGSHVTTFGHVQSSSLGEPPPTWVPTLVHWQKLVVDLRLKGLIVLLILYWLLFITKILDLFPLLAFVFVASLSSANYTLQELQ